MYTLLRALPRPAADGSDASAPVSRAARPRIGRTVLFLGLTSLFTDISSEMVTAILPLYFLVSLGFNPLQFGLLDGLYQGGAALVRVGGGFAADRWRRHKEVAFVGYALSAVAKLGLLLAGGLWGVVAGALVLDRLGKGIRTAPRDALIARTSSPAAWGVAFGVHRALDTVGALVGPVVAFLVLRSLAGAFDVVFVISFGVALIGLAVLALFVEPEPAPAADNLPETEAEPPTTVSLASVPRLAALPRFRGLIVIAAWLSVMTVSDSFLYLVLQRRLNLSFGYFPLLYVGTALLYFVFAAPAGWLADRVGRGRVFLTGYLFLAGVYVVLLWPGLGEGGAVLALLLLGAYYAATDGVLAAYASALVPAPVRASGLALLVTATGLGSLVGSLLFGALWTWRGPSAAVVVCLVGLLAGVAVASAWMVTQRRMSAHA